MKLVFDTNVLFAAFVSRGKCAALYELALATQTIVTSVAILDELEEKLVTKGKLPAAEALTVRQMVANAALIAAPAPLPAPACRDPDDDLIIGTAVSASADLIVTGDKDLLVLVEYGSILIVTPAECLAKLQAAK